MACICLHTGIQLIVFFDKCFTNKLAVVVVHSENNNSGAVVNKCIEELKSAAEFIG